MRSGSSTSSDPAAARRSGIRDDISSDKRVHPCHRLHRGALAHTQLLWEDSSSPHTCRSMAKRRIVEGIPAGPCRHCNIDAIDGRGGASVCQRHLFTKRGPLWSRRPIPQQ